MSWVVWRQYRAQWAIALALLAIFAAAVIVTGLQMASAWHAMLATCDPASPGNSCGNNSIVTTLGNDMRLLSFLVPAVLGILWGAPLVAQELETGTTTFAWTQGITRTRWLAAKAGLPLLAAAVYGGAVSALFTWWSGPVNAQTASAFGSDYFDTQGIAPIGYAVFAMALGITAGALLRRTLPAIAITIGGFIGLRMAFDYLIRPRLMPPVTAITSLTGPWSSPGISWLLGTGVINSAGQVVSGGTAPVQAVRGGPLAGVGFDGVPASIFPAACQKLVTATLGRPPANPLAQVSQVNSCLARYGFREIVTFQPGYRYWPFQGIEAGIYLVLAAALLAVTFLVIRNRDAY